MLSNYEVHFFMVIYTELEDRLGMVPNYRHFQGEKDYGKL